MNISPIEFAKANNLKILNAGDGNERIITGVYCCDLLSIVMGRAKENDAWITVMGNINSVAVAVLSDVSCIILSEGLLLDAEASQKAIQQNICVLSSELTTYELAVLLDKSLTPKRADLHEI